MYFIFGILLIVGIVCCFFLHYRKKRVIRRICKMSFCEKYCKLNELIHPWGFSYLPSQDIFTSELDAWQRQFGYHSLFDQSAPHFNMVFDCEPIYFNYQGRTWRIEFWKGQYGINTGGEIGVYCADSIVAPEQYADAHFHSVEDSQLLCLEMELYEKGCRLFQIRERHWWLTGFCMGRYSEPGNLEMRVSVTCLDQEMLCGFVGGLLTRGYNRCELDICENTVAFTFSVPRSKQPTGRSGCRAGWSQWKNRLFCRIYCKITDVFTCTLDRLLYLYFMVPFAFRRLLCFRKNRKQKKHRKGSMCV